MSLVQSLGGAVFLTTTHRIVSSDESSPRETYVNEASTAHLDPTVTAATVSGGVLASSPPFVITSEKRISSQEQANLTYNDDVNAVHLCSQMNNVSTQETQTGSVSSVEHKAGDKDPVGVTSFPTDTSDIVKVTVGSSDNPVLREDTTATSPQNSTDSEREKSASVNVRGNDTEDATVHLGGIGIQRCPPWSCQDRCFLNTVTAASSATTPASARDASAVAPSLNATDSEVIKCACDKSCIKLGDCCVDFFSVCLNITDETEVLAILERALYDSDNASIAETGEVNATQMILSHGSCVKSPEGERYTMVTGCPSSFTGQRVVVDTCEKADKHPNLQPYSDMDYMTITFRNLFCARCHGYEEEKLLPWILGVSCKGLGASTNFTLPGDSLSGDSQSDAQSSNRYDLTEIIAAMRSGDCKYVYRPPPNTLTKPRVCFPSTEMDALNPALDLHSNVTVSDKKCTFKDMLLCRSYSYQTFTSDNVEVKNPHCLKCQTGHSPISVDLPCSRKSNSSSEGDSGYSGQDRGGILALFSRDTSSGTDSIVVGGHKISWPGFLCNNDQVFDYVFLVCRTLFCPPGFRAVGGKCSRVHHYFVPGSLQMMPEGTEKVYLTVGMTRNTSCQNQQSAIQRIVKDTFEKAYRRHTKDTSVDTFPSIDFACVGFDGEEGANPSQVQRSSLQMTVYPVSNLSTMLDALLDVARERFENYLMYGSVKITNYAEEPQVECTVGHPELTDSANITTIEGELYVERSENAVASFYPLTNVVFRIDLTKPNGTDIKFRKTKLRVDHVISCSCHTVR